MVKEAFWGAALWYGGCFSIMASAIWFSSSADRSLRTTATLSQHNLLQIVQDRRHRIARLAGSVPSSEPYREPLGHCSPHNIQKRSPDSFHLNVEGSHPGRVGSHPWNDLKTLVESMQRRCVAVLQRKAFNPSLIEAINMKHRKTENVS